MPEPDDQPRSASTPTPTPTPAPITPARGSAPEVLGAFLRLGLTSFGGPVAHLGYFRSEFVERRRWLDDRGYADLVALGQFLPGPASSQVGFAIGLQRAGLAGGLAAWAGFTLPSAIALIVFAQWLQGSPGLASSGALHGLKLVAVAIVAQAVWGMGRSLCPDLPRAGLALAAAVLATSWPGAGGQLGAIGLGALVGRLGLRPPAVPAEAGATLAIGRRAGALLLALAGVLLLLLPLAAAAWPVLALQAAAVVYQAGALVFGGGHVVLPLLQAGMVPPGWVTQADFVAGYGAAQAVPGPLFTFAAYLGAVMPSPLGGWGGGLLLLVLVFLPGLLLMAGAAPFWEAWRRREGTRRIVAGLNAAVVGLLLAALVDPVWPSAVHRPLDALLALLAFGLLVVVRVPPPVVVLLGAAAGALLGG